MRHHIDPEINHGIPISIHAPVKGATPMSKILASSWIYFNPRTREGCDSAYKAHQSAGSWISIHAPVKGATFIVADDRDIRVISIHAPVKGATVYSQDLLVYKRNFNPRTREGCDLGTALSGHQGQLYFNPRTREGCDTTAVKEVDIYGKFQSTHP